MLFISSIMGVFVHVLLDSSCHSCVRKMLEHKIQSLVSISHCESVIMHRSDLARAQSLAHKAMARFKSISHTHTHTLIDEK
jgi:hypothetical protein